jgi:mutator protein MutT
METPFYPLTVFRFCPRCGAENGEYPTIKLFVCRACNFRYYQNAAAATIAIIRDPNGRVLFTRREKEPARGKLDLPGGFVDPLETAEESLRREAREEVGLNIERADFLASFTNRYDYRGVTYYSLDLVFLCDVSDFSPLAARDEVLETLFLAPETVSPEEIGFESVRQAIRLLCDREGRASRADNSSTPSPNPLTEPLS